MDFAVYEAALTAYNTALTCALSYSKSHPWDYLKYDDIKDNVWLPVNQCIKFKLATLTHNALNFWPGGSVVERRTRDQKVAGSTPGRGAIKSTR